jgi:hypothetical protein
LGNSKDLDEQIQDIQVMNHDQIAGNWKQVKGMVRKKWGKLNDDDVDVIVDNHAL